MSKRASESSTIYESIDHSDGVEDSQEDEKFNVRRQSMRRLLALMERQKLHFYEPTRDLSLAIFMVSFIISYLYLYLIYFFLKRIGRISLRDRGSL